MAKAEIKIEVGKSLRDVLAEVASAWKAAEAGTPVEPSSKLVFVDEIPMLSLLDGDVLNGAVAIDDNGNIDDDETGRLRRLAAIASDCK